MRASPHTLLQLGAYIQESLALAAERRLPVVIDGSALNFVVQHPEWVRGATNVLLTPNIAEFGRLAAAVNLKLPGAIGAHWQQHVRACVRV
jgi:NAD(P)H-hydrate repair Nnr-like enzyme with NAD(P)H-hydrate dehydratase domain